MIAWHVWFVQYPHKSHTVQMGHRVSLFESESWPAGMDGTQPSPSSVLWGTHPTELYSLCVNSPDRPGHSVFSHECSWLDSSSPCNDLLPEENKNVTYYFFMLVIWNTCCTQCHIPTLQKGAAFKSLPAFFMQLQLLFKLELLFN